MNEIFNRLAETFSQIFSHPMYLVVGAVFILFSFIILFDFD
jgi:low affinity Fe/Cu permease